MSAGGVRRIGWSLAGEGWGHASRNLIFIEEMHRRGYAIDIYTYGDSYRALAQHFNVHPLAGVRLYRIPGFLFAYDAKGRIEWGKVIARNLTPLVEGLRSFPSLVRRIRRMEYDLFVMDFEPVFSRAVARSLHSAIRKGRPHAPQVQVSAAMAAIAYAQLERPRGMNRAQYALMRSFMRHFEPRPEHVVIVQFFRPKGMPAFCRYAGAVVRAEVRQARARDGGYILVYMKPIVERLLFPIVDHIADLRKQEFIVYCSDPGKFTHHSPYLTVKRTGLSGGFLQDFAGCKAVVSTGGTELAAEALWLEKPLLAVMQTYQYEQYVSGHYVRKMGFGDAVVSADLTRKHVEDFLDRLPRYRSRVKIAKKAVPWGFKTIPDILESYLR